jgi:excinuclease UvrABC nuclease subunit
MDKKRLDPLDELSDESLRKVRILTDEIHKATDNMEYNLQTDSMKVPGQNWACVSFVSPSGNQKNKHLGMKIRGVFETNEEAFDYVKKLIRIDPTFDIFVCEMYNWCLVPPDPEMITNQTYQDETLNSIISEYRKNQIYAKEHFEERKREMVQQAAEEARRAALKRMEEESQSEMIRAELPLELPNDETRIRDITETSEEGVGVSASEIMDSMVGCIKSS